MAEQKKKHEIIQARSRLPACHAGFGLWMEPYVFVSVAVLTKAFVVEEDERLLADAPVILAGGTGRTFSFVHRARWKQER